MNLEIQTDLTVLPSAIDFNFDELKAEISSKLEYYNNIIVTEDTMKSAKSDRADLNKLTAAIDDRRKEVKKICLKAYEPFAEKCTELTTLIKDSASTIDSQIKELEDIRNRRKYAELEHFFNENAKELSEMVSLEKIVNPKWKNVSANVETLKNEIGDKLDLIRTDLETIKKQYGNSPHEAAVTLEYCKEYNLSKTLVYAAELEYNAKMQAKLQQKSEPEITAEPVPTPEPDSDKTPEIDSVLFEVWGEKSKETIEELKSLTAFLKSLKHLNYKVIRR